MFPVRKSREHLFISVLSAFPNVLLRKVLVNVSRSLLRTVA